ncbi:potassium channel family protein [Gracilibacillus lacisalsi]|uniref:potassium channel family protein n=1 Tax=Gracilibacillus lacisalsi TaxID=393087 RepID=UPI000363A101|nr:potassium channel family protein [Gracilibacillus lacisalsi]
MSQFLLIAAILFIIIHLVYFFQNKTYKQSYFSTALFMKLFFVLCGVTFGFALLYYALSFEETVIVQDLSAETPVEHSFSNLLYFSGVTILSIGYGDMIPVNTARFFALLQAAIGVLLPTAYFIKVLDQSRDE